MKNLKGRVALGVVGGSDIDKIVDQLGSNKNDLLSLYEFVFAENGLTGYCGSEPLPEMVSPPTYIGISNKVHI